MQEVIQMKFGEVLCMLMEKHDITHEQLAKVLRISETKLTNYTHCILEPDFDALKRMAMFFDVRIDDLLDYKGVPYKSEHQMEGELLQAFSELSPMQQRLFLDHGKIIAKICAGNKNTAE